ncbi:hypothetical protein D027_4819B, partial [Vibrio parahaemolyticus 861]|jgi:hypothetical protein
LAYS